MKKIVAIGMICLLVFMAGCNEATESVSETSSTISESSTTIEVPDVVDGYLLVIDHLVNYHTGISSRDKYLAIDTSKMVNLTPDDKTRLIKALEKYKLQILNKTRDELEEEGYIQKTSFENGILIEIEDRKMMANSITMDASRYRDGLNAYGLLDFRIRFISGHWEMTDISVTWVA